MTGKRSYLAGIAAEDIVARHYAAQGLAEAARRWRGAAGEIDLIFRDGAALVFVEVKTSARKPAAAQMLRPAQIARLMQAAEEFAGAQPAGLLTPMRFDVALVYGPGTVEIIENALGP